MLVGAYRRWAYELIRSIRPCRDVQSPERLLNEFHEMGPSLVVLIGWSWMVPPEIYEAVPTLCLHPSPLPRYRGGSPLQHQIIDGQNESAVTIFRVTGEIDAGPIYAQAPISLDGSLQDVLDRIVWVGAPMLRAIVDQFLRGQEPPTFPYDPCGRRDGEPRKRRTPAESEITSEQIAAMTARQLRDKVRALAHPDYPAAFIRGADGEPVYLWRVELEPPK